MCGILVRIGDGASDSDRRRFARALRLMAHRGPDGRAVWHEAGAALGHVRLAVIDRSPAAAQPMSDASGRFRIVHNGEVYNYRELRAELSSAGVRFRTDSDTEVVLAAYAHWGRACLERFNGMFAFAVYDRIERRVFAARDRLGVKPLYLAELADGLYLASEMKALLSLGASNRPRWGLVAQYLTGAGCDDGSATVFAGVEALPAGCALEARAGRPPRIERWWDAEPPRAALPARFAERAARFRTLLTDAVRLRLRSDVQTGVCLSGGLDSSTVYGLAQALRRDGGDGATHPGGALRAYVVTHPGTRVDERAWAERCVRHAGAGAAMSPVFIHPGRFPELVERAIRHQEAPVWSASALALHALYEHAAADGTRVVLEGHGGDELLGGYPYMVEAALRTFARRGRAWHAWCAARCLTGTRNAGLDEHGPPAWLEFLRAWPLTRRAWSWACWRLRTAPRGAAPAGAPRATFYRQPELRRAAEQPDAGIAGPGADGFDAAILDAVTRRILPIVLRVVDRASMASGVESRAPLLDYRVVEFALALPAEDKVGRRSKHILRAAARGAVPRAVRRRGPKLGIALAEREWFGSPGVQAYLRDVFGSAAARESEVIDGRAVLAAVERGCAAGFTWQDTTRIWEALNVHLWHERFVRSERWSAVHADDPSVQRLSPSRPPALDAAAANRRDGTDAAGVCAGVLP